MTFPYTNNIPQAGQTKAFTQPYILNNFEYLEKEIGKEHNFDPTDATFMYHLQASMPNKADPAPGNLLTGTNGSYYVNNGQAKFDDGTNTFFMNFWTGYLTGSYTPTSESTYTNVVAVPANVFGICYFYRNNDPSFDNSATSGQFTTGAASCYGMTNLSDSGGSSTPIQLEFNTGTLFLKARAGSTRYNDAVAFKYIIMYRPV